MKSIKTLILHKTKWDSNTFLNFVITGAKKSIYSIYNLFGAIQFKKDKREFWTVDKNNASIEELRNFLKENYAESKNVLPYK